jgi:hypothetical protein
MPQQTLTGARKARTHCQGPLGPFLASPCIGRRRTPIWGKRWAGDFLRREFRVFLLNGFPYEKGDFSNYDNFIELGFIKSVALKALFQIPLSIDFYQ